MKISVCICTKNRHTALRSCLQSIAATNSSDYELVLVDQSDDVIMLKQNRALCQKMKIRYYHDANSGLARGRNLAIKKAHGDILIFTDDDCIVDKYWINNIIHAYKSNPDISGVFGQTLPFDATHHRNQICPSHISLKQRKVFSNPYIDHFNVLGNGNNMSIRKEVFTQLGFFKEWLGLGSISENGSEDGEYIYRMLSNGLCLLSDPSIIVHHNRWLSRLDYTKLVLQYNIGGTAFYTYELSRTHNKFFMHKLFNQRIVIYDRVTALVHSLINKEGDIKAEFKLVMFSIKMIVKGICIGLFYSVTELFRDSNLLGTFSKNQSA